MAVYRCTVCGYIFDEEKEGKKLIEPLTDLFKKNPYRRK